MALDRGVQRTAEPMVALGLRDRVLRCCDVDSLGMDVGSGAMDDLHNDQGQKPVLASIMLTIAGIVCTVAMIWLLVETAYY